MYYPQEAFDRRSKSKKRRKKHDPRTPFARDRDRLLYSSAFRRLAGKSQVVASTEIGPFHTRLTHSLKVAQLGRRLAEQIQAEFRKDLSPKSRTRGRWLLQAPDPDLVELACLAHDIGHPPFGHTGEVALHQAVDHLVAVAVENYLKGLGKEPIAGAVSEAQRYIGGFEGNPQTFRIVTRLSHKAFPGDEVEYSEEYLGLDLTAAAICAISKYPWGRETLAIKKWGAYGASKDISSDYSTLCRVHEGLKWDTPESGEHPRQSFECQLMDWCDDVTYAVHDVEDFYMIGMIPLERIFGYKQVDETRVFASLRDSDDEHVEDGDEEASDANEPNETGGAQALRRVRKSGGSRFPETDEWRDFRGYLQDKWADEPDHWDEPRDIDKDYLNSLRDDLIDIAYGPPGWDATPGSIKSRRLSQRRASDLIEHFASTNVSCDDRPYLNQGQLRLAKGRSERQKKMNEKRLRYQCDMLKELIWKYVINKPNLKTQQAGQRRVITDLIDTYAGDIELLPPHYMELAEHGSGYTGIPENLLLNGCIPRLAQIRAAADYVSSLTEPQALALHKRLTGTELGGFRDFV